MLTAPRRATLSRVLGTCVLLALAVAPAGCRTWGEVEYAREYPSGTPIGPTLNVQVVRDGTQITITNTGASPIPATTLWLNQWYSRPIDEVGVGETARFNLREFRDVFSEPFRAGGFWATDAGVPLVAAHLELNGRLVPLVVVTRRGG
jgi:hypothetical protein